MTTPPGKTSGRINRRETSSNIVATADRKQTRGLQYLEADAGSEGRGGSRHVLLWSTGTTVPVLTESGDSILAELRKAPCVRAIGVHVKKS